MPSNCMTALQIRQSDEEHRPRESLAHDFHFKSSKLSPGGGPVAGLRWHCFAPLKRWHCLEPFLSRKLFHIVQGLWGNDPAIFLIELWKLPLRSTQPTQEISLSFCHPDCHKDLLVAVRGYQHQTVRSGAHPITRNTSVKLIAIKQVLDVHGHGKGNLSYKLLSPFLGSPFLYFPDFLALGSRHREPFHLLHLTQQLFRLGSQDQLDPPFFNLLDGGCEITLGERDDTRHEQITDSITPPHHANGVVAGRDGNEDISLLVVQFKR